VAGAVAICQRRVGREPATPTPLRREIEQAAPVDPVLDHRLRLTGGKARVLTRAAAVASRTRPPRPSRATIARLAQLTGVGYTSRMAVSRRWLVGVTCWMACAGTSSTPQPEKPRAMTQATRPPVASPAPVEPPAPTTPEQPPKPCPDDPGRDGRQKPDHVIQLMALSDGMTVVDLGSGDGYFLCRLSRAVGPSGRVIATEIDEQLVRDLTTRAAREQLSNVDVIQAPKDDVGIPPETADRILLVNVWHHIANRRRYAPHLARALKRGGKAVIIDFKRRSRRSTHGISPAQVITDLAAGGITATLVPEDLADQYTVIGTRN
jgi:predicted methyltransferase